MKEIRLRVSDTDTGPPATEEGVYVYPDSKGAPSFHGYVSAVYHAVPDDVLEVVPGTTEASERLAAVVGHLIDGLADFLVGCYGDEAEQACDTLNRELLNMVRSSKAPQGTVLS